MCKLAISESEFTLVYAEDPMTMWYKCIALNHILHLPITWSHLERQIQLFCRPSLLSCHVPIVTGVVLFYTKGSVYLSLCSLSLCSITTGSSLPNSPNTLANEYAAYPTTSSSALWLTTSLLSFRSSRTKLGVSISRQRNKSFFLFSPQYSKKHAAAFKIAH